MIKMPVDIEVINAQLKRLNINLELSQSDTFELQGNFYQCQQVQYLDKNKDNFMQNQKYYYRAMPAEEANNWFDYNIYNIIADKSYSIPFASHLNYSKKYITVNPQDLYCVVLEICAPNYKRELARVGDKEGKNESDGERSFGIGYKFVTDSSKVKDRVIRSVFREYMEDERKRAMLENILRMWNLNESNMNGSKYIKVLRPVMFMSSIEYIKIVGIKKTV